MAREQELAQAYDARGVGPRDLPEAQKAEREERILFRRDPHSRRKLMIVVPELPWLKSRSNAFGEESA